MPRRFVSMSLWWLSYWCPWMSRKYLGFLQRLNKIMKNKSIVFELIILLAGFKRILWKENLLKLPFRFWNKVKFLWHWKFLDLVTQFFLYIRSRYCRNLQEFALQITKTSLNTFMVKFLTHFEVWIYSNLFLSLIIFIVVIQLKIA